MSKVATKPQTKYRYCLAVDKNAHKGTLEYMGVEKQVVENFPFHNLYVRNKFAFATVLTWVLLPAN